MSPSYYMIFSHSSCVQFHSAELCTGFSVRIWILQGLHFSWRKRRISCTLFSEYENCHKVVSVDCECFNMTSYTSFSLICENISKSCLFEAPITWYQWYILVIFGDMREIYALCPTIDKALDKKAVRVTVNGDLRFARALRDKYSFCGTLDSGLKVHT